MTSEDSKSNNQVHIKLSCKINLEPHTPKLLCLPAIFIQVKKYELLIQITIHQRGGGLHL